MNKQEVKHSQTQQNTISVRPDRKKSNTGRLRLLRAGMVLVGGMVIVIGLLLVILPLFKIKAIEVNGCKYYSEEAIIASTDISIGGEMMAIDRGGAIEQILASCEYVDRVSVSCKFPSTVVIKIEERKDLMYTEVASVYYAFDGNFRVLSASEAPFEGFTCVSLPETAAMEVGKKIAFADASIDPSYITEIMGALNERDELSDVTLLDCSRRYGISYILGNSRRICIGSMQNLEIKLRLSDEILQTNGDSSASLCVVDVSDLQKPSYRTVSDLEMLLGE